MKHDSDPINRLFRMAKEAQHDEENPFGPEASSEALKKVKGGFGDVKGDACVAAPGAIMTTHNQGMSQSK